MKQNDNQQIIDKLLKIKKGDNFIISGICGSGKTKLALNVFNKFTQNKSTYGNIIYFSVDENKETIIEKLYEIQLKDKSEVLNNSLILCAPLTLKDFKKHIIENNIDIAFIDPFDMVSFEVVNNNLAMSYQLTLNEIKKLGKELNISIILVQQAKRNNLSLSEF